MSDEVWLYGIVPKGFDAYARVFHPAYREVADGEAPSMLARHFLHWPPGGGPADEEMVYTRAVRWVDVAAANGRVAHPTMEWAAITGDWAHRYGHASQPDIWDLEPTRGSLDLWPTILLCERLAAFTTTPDRCLFGVSHIYGDLPPSLRRGAPIVAGTHVVSGPLFAPASISFGAHDHRGPNLWWPADQAWCVTSDYDLQVTHIAGSERCIDALVADSELEVMRIDPAQPATDDINPEPRGTYCG